MTCSVGWWQTTCQSWVGCCYTIPSTRARCECVAHALQSTSELDESATILSVDGVGAFLDARIVEGDPLPLLFVFAQHSTLVAISNRLQGEFLLVFHDDLHIKSPFWIKFIFCCVVLLFALCLAGDGPLIHRLLVGLR